MSVEQNMFKKWSLFLFLGIFLITCVSTNKRNLKVNYRSVASNTSPSTNTETALISKEQQLARYCVNNPKFDSSKHECLTFNVINQCLCWTDCTKINGFGKCVDWSSCKRHNLLRQCMD